MPLFFLHVVQTQRLPPPTHAASPLPRHEPASVPARAWAVPRSDKDDSDAQGPRDGYIQLMAKRGRMGWQKATRYSRRNQAKTEMARYRHLIGQTLSTRSLPVQ